MAEIKSILQKIQTELKAPKGQFNKFGNYKYRSCEDILEAVKPLLAKYGAVITVGDDLVYLEGRFYVKATATMISETEKVCVSAFAREPEEKKGMDASQITGTASSYARKYALNGMFCIDDNKDADDPSYQQNKDENISNKISLSLRESIKKKEVDTEKVQELLSKAAEKGKNLDEPALCKMLKIESFEQMNYGQLNWFNNMMEKNGI